MFQDHQFEILIDSWVHETYFNNKRDDYIFPIVNFPFIFISSNITTSPTLGLIFHNAYVLLRLVFNTGIFSTELSYSTQMLLKLSYVALRLQVIAAKFYDHHYESIDSYEISISQIAIDIFPFMWICLFSLSLT